MNVRRRIKHVVSRFEIQTSGKQRISIDLQPTVFCCNSNTAAATHAGLPARNFQSSSPRLSLVEQIPHRRQNHVSVSLNISQRLIGSNPRLHIDRIELSWLIDQPWLNVVTISHPNSLFQLRRTLSNIPKTLISRLIRSFCGVRLDCILRKLGKRRRDPENVLSERFCEPFI
jgi:hypothetical protein